jgi:RimJ/RimL family protein N-acetyltransferase
MTPLGSDQLPTFTTARLTLRPRTLADLDPCLAMDRDPLVTKFIHGPWAGTQTTNCAFKWRKATDLARGSIVRYLTLRRGALPKPVQHVMMAKLTEVLMWWEKVPDIPSARSIMKGWVYEVDVDADYNAGTPEHGVPFAAARPYGDAGRW